MNIVDNTLDKIITICYNYILSNALYMPVNFLILEASQPSDIIALKQGSLLEKQSTHNNLEVTHTMSNSEKKLGAMVEEFVGKTTAKAIPTSASLSFGFPETKRANVALHNMNDEQRIEFLKGVLEHWGNAVYNSSDRLKALEELHTIFGNTIDHIIGRRLMYTLTADGHQFRIWEGRPASITPGHVDSCGTGDVMHVSGSTEVVKKYVDAFISSRMDEKVILLPNGVKIWGFWWDWH